MTELPKGWVEVPIGDVCQVVGGSTPSTKVDKYWDGEIPWLTPDDLARDRSQYLSRGRRTISKAGYASCSTQMVPAGTVVFTSRAPIGYVAIARQPLCTNQGFKSFVPPDGLSSEYLYWYLQWATPMIRAMGSGTTFAEISGKVAKTIPLRLPPLPEQERIVAAIEEQLSRIEAAHIALASARQKVDILAGLPFREVSAAAMVPFGDLLLEPLVNGRSVPTADVGFPVLRLTALKNGGIDLSEHKVGAWDRPDAERFLVKRGDFLISRGNGSLSLVARGGLVDQEPDEVAFPDTMIRARGDSDRVLPEFLRLVWNGPVVRRQIERAARTTAGIYKVNQQDLARVSLPVPPLEVQRRVVDAASHRASVLDAVATAADQGLGRGAILCRSILAYAFLGRLVPQDQTDEPAGLPLKPIAGTGVASTKSLGRARR